MLSRIFKAAQLSKRYTKYCVRATSIVLLKKAGFDDRAVCNILATRMSKAWTATVAQASGRSSHCPQRLTARPQAVRRCRHQPACSLKSSCEPEEFTEMSTCESIAVQGHPGTAQAAFSSKKTVFKHVTFNFSAGEAVADRARAARKMLKIRKK